MGTFIARMAITLTTMVALAATHMVQWVMERMDLLVHTLM